MEFPLLKQHPDFKTVPWTLRQTITGTLWTLVPYILYTFANYVTSLSSHPSSTPLSFQADLINAIVIFFYSIIGEGVFLIAPLYFAWQATRDWSGERSRKMLDALGFRSFNLKHVVPWIILLFLSILLFNYLYQWCIDFFHLPLKTNDQAVLQNGKIAPLTVYASLLSAVFCAPICEEIFFRSFMFMGSLRVLSVPIAVVLSAFLFALAHGDPGSFIVLFYVGMVLAFIRWYSKSIWPGIIIHTLNNGLSAILIVLTITHVI